MRELARPSPASRTTGGRPHLERLATLAARSGGATAAVVYPCSATAVESVAMAEQACLIHPVVIGPRARIERIAAETGIDTGEWRFVDSGEHGVAAARVAVDLCRSGEAALVMKGSLHTDELLSVLVGKESGLRTERRMSHVFAMDIPGVRRPLLLADCVVNVSPTLVEKRDITQGAIDVAHAMGMARPYVALLSAVETINPAIPATLDAAILCKMAQRGQITGGELEGPLSYDVAMSPEAARTKGIPMADFRQPDILIMPNMEAGNILYKHLIHGNGAGCAGIVVGLRVPVVCNSRSESPENRVASCALAVLQMPGEPA